MANNPERTAERLYGAPSPTNESNPSWSGFEQAVITAGEKLTKPEILPFYYRCLIHETDGNLPTLGFSPMKNTPILLHDHYEFLKDTIYLEGIKKLLLGNLETKNFLPFSMTL